MRLLALSGSLRNRASNTALLEAAQLLAPDGVTISVYDGIGRLPHFNPDIESSGLPDPVSDFRELIGQVGGLIISTPEYAHGLPGSFKNALDWLVGSVTFPGMPVMLMSASSMSTHAPAALREILRTMSAKLVSDADVTVELRGRSPVAADLVSDPEVAGAIKGGLARFVRGVSELRATV